MKTNRFLTGVFGLALCVSSFAFTSSVEAEPLGMWVADANEYGSEEYVNENNPEEYSFGMGGIVFASATFGDGISDAAEELDSWGKIYVRWTWNPANNDPANEKPDEQWADCELVGRLSAVTRAQGVVSNWLEFVHAHAEASVRLLTRTYIEAEATSDVYWFTEPADADHDIKPAKDSGKAYRFQDELGQYRIVIEARGEANAAYGFVTFSDTGNGFVDSQTTFQVTGSPSPAMALSP